MTVMSAACVLLLVLDPFGNIPFFLVALKRVEGQRRKKIMARELLIALGVLVFFLFTGNFILRLLDISEPSLTAAGGIILFLIAVRMIFPPHRGGGAFEEDLESEPFIVPLAVPYVAGPSAVATVLLISTREPERWPEWLLAITIAWLATAAVVLLSDSLRRFLGEKVLTAIERLMGMVLATLAVQMLLNGIEQWLARG